MTPRHVRAYQVQPGDVLLLDTGRYQVQRTASHRGHVEVLLTPAPGIGDLSWLALHPHQIVAVLPTDEQGQ